MWTILYSCPGNFYPRSPCGERRCLRCCAISCITISIHALLAESDPPRVIREPATSGFLSTLSLRRATIAQLASLKLFDYFYPRSPCGERRARRESRQQPAGISIHALLAESDGGSGVGNWPRVIFLSTLSLRRATALRQLQFALRRNFYPRSPCGERLAEVGGSNQTIINFYPRSPCGERQFRKLLYPGATRFLSTLSLRRATKLKTPCVKLSIISIHALLAESDLHCNTLKTFRHYFYPRSPCGERPVCVAVQSPASQFLSTLSLRRATHQE